MEKELYGYDNVLVRYLQEDEKSIPKGSFTILSRSGKLYWYFNHSKGKNRLEYLCSPDARLRVSIPH